MDSSQEKTQPRGLEAAIRVEQIISAALVALILGLVSLQVAGRFLLTSPKTWTGELAQFGLIWLVFIGAAFVMARGRHITVTIVDHLLGPRGRMAVDIVSSLIILATSIVLLPASLRFMVRMNSIESPAAQVPMSVVYAAGLFGFGLLALHCLIRLVVAIRQGPAGYADE